MTALFADGPVIVDGGLSTQLESRGQDISGRLWTARTLLEDPGQIVAAHADFLAAGADVVITASYQVSRAGFEADGRSAAGADRALAASVAAARQAVRAAGRPAWVAASVGPYGAILHDGSEYRGDYGLDRGTLTRFHHERLEVLVDAEPDLLAIETIPDLREAEALVDALAGVDLPAWMTFSARDDAHTCAGQRIEDAVAVAARSPQVVAVGINCTDPALVTALVRRIADTVDLPIVVYPNAGGQWDATDGQWRGADAATTDQRLAEWQEAGAIAIGGCCGTDASAISRIAAALGRTGT